jgi:polar amino acid transport system substrate-binding protein
MPTAEATYYYVKRKGDERIKSTKDLSGLPFGTQQGSAMQQRLPEVEALMNKLGGTLGRPSFYVSYPDAFQDLALGRVDFVIANVVPITDLIRKRPNEFELGEAVASVTYHAWAVKKGNKDLRDFLDQFLGEQRRNGTMARLQEKWLGKSFSDLPWVPMLPGNRPMPD